MPYQQSSSMQWHPDAKPLPLCACSAVFCRGSTQRATQRGSQDNQSAAWRTHCVRQVLVESGMGIFWETRGEVVDSCKWPSACMVPSAAESYAHANKTGAESLRGVLLSTTNGSDAVNKIKLAPQAQLRLRVLQRCSTVPRTSWARKGEVLHV